MRRVDNAGLAAVRSLIVVPVLINLLTPLISIEWYKKWWWLIVGLLVLAVWPLVYLRKRRDSTISRVAAASDRAGTLYLFAVTHAGDVLRRTLREQGSWSDWENHGFAEGHATDVAAVVPGHDRLETYAADSTGSLWGRRRGPDGWSWSTGRRGTGGSCTASGRHGTPSTFLATAPPAWPSRR